MKLEDLKPGQSLAGIEPSGRVVTVVAVQWHGDDAVRLIYDKQDGEPSHRLLGREHEATIAEASDESPFLFSGDGKDFRLVCEAKRIELAYLFDPMMAVHSSDVDPLPHQITAVYESMLPRQRLRFLLADDPGAGKTIMTGLYIRELLVRADSDRILVVAPGSLVDQWREELHEKFGLRFAVYTKEMKPTVGDGFPFEGQRRLIVRLDQCARNEELQEQLCKGAWDLAVFDEAHKLSAKPSGSGGNKTGRFKFAEKLGGHVRHLLLLTATPHNGKEGEFQMFLSLLDPDRYGRTRGRVRKTDPSDMMRRMVKEELVTFENKPLFPERRATTVRYKLSSMEAKLYEAVTRYVTTEMDKAEVLESKRGRAIGFALTSIQRRLASSPEAIFQSLMNRRKRLSGGKKWGKGLPKDDDDLTAEEREEQEEEIIGTATAAGSPKELEDEIAILGDLARQAKKVLDSRRDRKWEELSGILQAPEMAGHGGKRRKLIIFSEYVATLNYLRGRIAEELGDDDAVVTIHGGHSRAQRLDTQVRFRSDPTVQILVATDAAGEGVNLQHANLMVNYDLPWNPNRLEQRFGRIHRIGQTEVCHLWNLVAEGTREGDVYYRLLDKLEAENEALQGRVFDILGEVFEGASLSDLLQKAIRYGDDPERLEEFTREAEAALDRDHLRRLLARNALSGNPMDQALIFKVKEDMEKAEARRLQPLFVRDFFFEALDRLGGRWKAREPGRFEVTQVPGAVQARGGHTEGHRRRTLESVGRRYERICFERRDIQPKPRVGRAVLMHPGHSLMVAMRDMILERNINLLRQGAVLLDPVDEGSEAALIFLLTHEVKDGGDHVLSQRLQFVRASFGGQPSFAGWAPHLDLKPLDEKQLLLVQDVAAEARRMATEKEAQAVKLAVANLVPEHYNEVAQRHIDHVEKTLEAVRERLGNAVAHERRQLARFEAAAAEGKDERLNIRNTEGRINELEGKLADRTEMLEESLHLSKGIPSVIGAMLVVPAGLIAELEGNAMPGPGRQADPAARKRIEKLAMDAVREAEEARGCRIEDVSAEKCGWDITSQPPAEGDEEPQARHIEVKGRAKGANTVTVTRNELLYALNQGDKFVLAIVLVGDDDSTEGPYYVRELPSTELDWGVVSINFDLSELLARAEEQ